MDANDTKRILGELCALAPSTEVRNCIRLYKPEASYTNIKMAISQTPVPHLAKTLDYLNASCQFPWKDLTKDGLVRKLILRLHNLMPETCHQCENSFVISKEYKPRLPCENCGQEYHPKCLADRLEVDIETLDPGSIWFKLNPFNTPGFVYICQRCKGKAVEEDSSHLKQSAIKRAWKSELAQQTATLEANLFQTSAEPTCLTPSLECAASEEALLLRNLSLPAVGQSPSDLTTSIDQESKVTLQIQNKYLKILLLQ